MNYTNNSRSIYMKFVQMVWNDGLIKQRWTNGTILFINQKTCKLINILKTQNKDHYFLIK